MGIERPNNGLQSDEQPRGANTVAFLGVHWPRGCSPLKPSVRQTIAEELELDFEINGNVAGTDPVAVARGFDDGRPRGGWMTLHYTVSDIERRRRAVEQIAEKLLGPSGGVV